jgi:integrase
MTIRKGSARIAAVPVERQFATIAWRWFDNNSDSWRTKYRDQVRSQLARLVVPTLAKRDIASITAPEVLAVLRAAEASSGRPTTRRCRQFFGCIFGLAVAEGLCQGDPSATLNKALKGRVASKPRPRVASQDIPALLLDISRYPKESIRLGLMLALHTGLRPGEVRTGRWKQIHDGKWRISADDMKMKKPHVVALSPQSKAILSGSRNSLAGRTTSFQPARRRR